MTPARGLWLVVALGLVSACAAERLNYRVQALEDAESADRVRIEREGLHVVLGPPTAFPYSRPVDPGDGNDEETTGARDVGDRAGGAPDGRPDDDGGTDDDGGPDGAGGEDGDADGDGDQEEPELEEGSYQLFTLVRVENRGSRPAVVLWHRAHLVGPDRSVIGLIESERAGASHLRASSGPPAASPAPPRPRESVEPVEPGRMVRRALIPETLRGLEPGEPLVPLCDSCIYRMVIPVRIGDREIALELPFRFEAVSPRGRSLRILFWER